MPTERVATQPIMGTELQKIIDDEVIVDSEWDQDIDGCIDEWKEARQDWNRACDDIISQLEDAPKHYTVKVRPLIARVKASKLPVPAANGRSNS